MGAARKPDGEGVSLKNRISQSLGVGKVICRLISSWLLLSLINSLTGAGKFDELSFAQNTPISASALIFAMIFAGLTALSAWERRHNTDSWALAAAGMGCALTWLTNYRDTSNRAGFCLACIVFVLLVLAYFIKENRRFICRTATKIRLFLDSSGVAAAICAAVLALVMFAFISVVTVMRYQNFSSPNFDFGLFVNMFHNMSKTGLPLVTSERDALMSHFAVHISPIYYLLLPFYMLIPSPITLQLGQAAVVALGMIAAYLLAKRMGLKNSGALAACAVYAFYPALSTGCFYDLHENCFLAVCLLFTFYFYESKKYLPMYIFAALTLCVKEDAAVYIIIFAVYVLISASGIRRIHGAVLGAVSAGYFAFCVYMLQKFGQGVMSYRYENFIPDGSQGLLGAVRTLFVNPGYILTQLFATSDASGQKIIYLLLMMLPVGFLPLLTKKPSRWLLCTPILLNLLTMYNYQYQISYQYGFGISAFLIYAMILNLSDMRSAPPQRCGSVCLANAAVGIALVSCLCIYSSYVVQNAASQVKRYSLNYETYAEMNAILDEIPSDASLCVSSMLLAHVADRSEVYEAEVHEISEEGGYTEYVALDMRSGNTELLQKYLDLGYTPLAGSQELVMVLKL